MKEPKETQPKIMQYGIKLVMGDGDVPKLPVGWTIRRNGLCPAVAIAPDGTEYLIGDGVLFPWLEWPPKYMKPGQRYIDTNAAVKIPAV